MASVIEPKNEKGSKSETKQDNASTTPLTKGFANNLSSILKNDKSSWEQFTQLVEHITTIPRNNFLRHDKIIGEIKIGRASCRERV